MSDFYKKNSKQIEYLEFNSLYIDNFSFSLVISFLLSFASSYINFRVDRVLSEN